MSRKHEQTQPPTLTHTLTHPQLVMLLLKINHVYTDQIENPFRGTEQMNLTSMTFCSYMIWHRGEIKTAA